MDIVQERVTVNDTFNEKGFDLSGRTHNMGFVSLNSPYVTIETPLVKKATELHLMKSSSLEKLRALSRVSAALEIQYVMQLSMDFVSFFRADCVSPQDAVGIYSKQSFAIVMDLFGAAHITGSFSKCKISWFLFS